MEYVTKNRKETERVAANFAETLQPGDFVALYGDLGVGKTVFCKSVVQTLAGSDAVSPTFTLLNEYYGKCPIYHFDVYRLKNANELENIGYEEYFYGDGICLVEWPDRIKDYLPQHRKEIHIQRINENSRRILIEDK